MKKLFSLEHSLELLASIIALGAFLAVLQSFIIGKHYIIPTAWLLLTVLFGNLARSGLRGEYWAQALLFWMFFLATANTFMGIFFAQTPKELLAGAFLPVYILLFAVLAFLTWQYAKRNGIPR